jgi:hypothetical protein
MRSIGFFLLLFILGPGCKRTPLDYLNSNQIQDCAWQEQSDFAVRGAPAVRGALVSTRFRSYDELRAAIGITHYPKRRDTVRKAASGVGLTHCSNGLEVVSILRSGVSEKDFVAARDGGFWDRISLVFKSPYAVIHRKALQKVSILARRRPDVYGEGDPAFYDLSEHIMAHIVEDDLPKLDSLDLASEKGYFNTVNHITAQVFMTALFFGKSSGSHRRCPRAKKHAGTGNWLVFPGPTRRSRKRSGGQLCGHDQ